MVALGVQRGTETVTVNVTVTERSHPIDELADVADPEKSSVSKLGIIGIDVAGAAAALLPGLRISSGVLVMARSQVSSGNDVPLVAGDVIHAVNSFAVRSVDGLRALVDDARANSELVLQIERNGQLMFVACEIY
jgi:S1-C subfamily serine protease